MAVSISIGKPESARVVAFSVWPAPGKLRAVLSESERTKDARSIVGQGIPDGVCGKGNQSTVAGEEKVVCPLVEWVPAIGLKDDVSVSSSFDTGGTKFVSNAAHGSRLVFELADDTFAISPPERNENCGRKGVLSTR